LAPYHEGWQRGSGEGNLVSAKGAAKAVSGYLVVAVGLVYLGVAIEQTLKGEWPMGIVFAGYAISNIGFLVALR
jgi:hypothetical protein